MIVYSLSGKEKMTIRLHTHKYDKTAIKSTVFRKLIIYSLYGRETKNAYDRSFLFYIKYNKINAFRKRGIYPLCESINILRQN